MDNEAQNETVPAANETDEVQQYTEESIRDDLYNELQDQVQQNLPDIDLDAFAHADNFTLAPQGDNASFSIKFGENELTLSSQIMEDGSEVLQQIFKFDKYFLYSYDTNAQKPGDPTPQCGESNDCNQEFEQLCCTNAIMTDAEHGAQTSIYRCMNKEVVNSNFDVEIDSFKVSMRCVQQETSSAGRLLLTAVLPIFSLALMAYF